MTTISDISAPLKYFSRTRSISKIVLLLSLAKLGYVAVITLKGKKECIAEGKSYGKIVFAKL